MINPLVKFFVDGDGEVIDKPVWHLVDCFLSDPAALCTGEYFGYGQSDTVYEEKTVKRGGITCRLCLEKIKAIKGVRL